MQHANMIENMATDKPAAPATIIHLCCSMKTMAVWGGRS